MSFISFIGRHKIFVFSGVRHHTSHFPKDGTHPLVKVPLTLEESIFASQAWRYPSDHLPVFGRVDDLRMGTLNVYNSLFTQHSQTVPGWNRSYLVEMEKEKSLAFPEFSLREEEIRQTVYTLLRERASVGVLCIQECSTKMHNLLERTLDPFNIAVILGDGGRNNHVATLVDLDVYSIQSVKITPVFRRYIREQKEWFWDKWRPAVDVMIEKRAHSFGYPRKFRIVNLHISSAGQSDEYKTDRLQEVRKYLEHSPEKNDFDVITGDLNACKSLTNSVFEKEAYISLCSHYSQIENIVPVKGAKNDAVEGPHMVSIDDVILRISDSAKSYHEASPIHPQETSDVKASQMLETVFDPLLAKRK